MNQESAKIVQELLHHISMTNKEFMEKIKEQDKTISYVLQLMALDKKYDGKNTFNYSTNDNQNSLNAFYIKKGLPQQETKDQQYYLQTSKGQIKKMKSKSKSQSGKANMRFQKSYKTKRQVQKFGQQVLKNAIIETNNASDKILKKQLVQRYLEWRNISYQDASSIMKLNSVQVCITIFMRQNFPQCDLKGDYVRGVKLIRQNLKKRKVVKQEYTQQSQGQQDQRQQEIQI